MGKRQRVAIAGDHRRRSLLRPDFGADRRRDLDFRRVGEFEPAHNIDGVMMWLDLGGLASVAPMDLVPAIEARRGVFSDRRQAKLCTIEGGTCHNAAWSVGADGLFRPNKIRVFLIRLTAGGTE